MNLIKLTVNYRDSSTCNRTIVRPITENISEEWIDGWFSGISEFISFRGGAISSFSREVINEQEAVT